MTSNTTSERNSTERGLYEAGIPVQERHRDLQADALKILAIFGEMKWRHNTTTDNNRMLAMSLLSEGRRCPHCEYTCSAYEAATEAATYGDLNSYETAKRQRHTCPVCSVPIALRTEQFGGWSWRLDLKALKTASE